MPRGGAQLHKYNYSASRCCEKKNRRDSTKFGCKYQVGEQHRGALERVLVGNNQHELQVSSFASIRNVLGRPTIGV